MSLTQQRFNTSTQSHSNRIALALAEADIARQINDRSEELTENARVVLARRYLSKDREGNILEDPDGMFRRVASNLSQADLNYGATEQERQEIEDEFYDMMRRLECLPNSPTLMNAGRELQQLSACFVLPVDDALDSIFDKVKQTALIHKSGGGTGFSFSRLRPAGDVVGSTGGVASGPVSFIRAFDTATDVVKQGGTRRGANMGILNVDHPDVLHFIRSKEDGQNLNNFNISIGVTDDFMEKVKSGQDYDLINPRTKAVVGQLNAREVFQEAVDMAWKTGDPGLVFLDKINRDNPNPQLGRIESTNPCITGDTWVQTVDGPRQVTELVGTPFTALVNGETYKSDKRGFFRTGNKAVFKLATKEGYRLRLTDNHIVMTNNGWQEAGTLKQGDVIILNAHCNLTQWPGQYGETEGLLLGKFFLKNPNRILINPRTHRAKRDPQEPIPEEKAPLDEIRRCLHIDPQYPTVTQEMEHTSSEFYIGFFRGLSYSHLEHTGKNPKCINIAPKKADRTTLEALQRMLLRLAIRSSIYYGAGYPELLVANEHFDRFNTAIRPSGSEKWLQHQQTPGDDKSFTAHVIKVKADGHEEVFDVAVPGVNAFDANGMVVHNCGEQPLLPYESCNLASVNLARMVRYGADGPVIDWERLARVVRTTVHLLDNVIDMNNYPIQEIEEMSKKTRRIGLGVMGFSDLLIQLGVRYDSEEGLAVAEQVMSRINEETVNASSELAESRGPFPAWEGSAYSKPGVFGEPRPMRNSAPTTIAPTGTISIIAGASSGVEPLFALSYVRNVMDNTRLVEGNPYFEAVAKREGFYSDDLMEQLAETGSLSRLDPSLGVPEWVKDVFRTSHDISPEWHVRMQAAFQKHTDNSVSKTINFPYDATTTDVATAYTMAYDLGCKGITVYRDGSKAGQVLSTGETGKQGASPDGAGADPDTLAELLPSGFQGYQTPRQRPQSIRGITERVRTGHGNMYVTLNFDDSGMPFEVFGNLGKAGGCDSAQLEAISRLVSLALRSGVDPNVVIEQLRGITCCPAWDEGVLVRSGPDAVALAMARHVEDSVVPGKALENGVQMQFIVGNARNGNGHYEMNKCPDCNAPVVYQEGCLKCSSLTCGWNKCE